MIPGDPLFNILWLTPLGFFTGLIATMVGLGGGFIIVPVLMLISPMVEPGKITSLSLAVIVLSSFSGTYAYAKQGRVDFRQGSLFAMAGIPGIAIGSWVVSRITRGTFDVVMGIVLISLGVFLLLGTRKPTPAKMAAQKEMLNTSPRSKRREQAGALISTLVGFISTVLGIGGGVIHVPAMIYILRYAPHRATATSQYVLACMATIATLFNLTAGHLEGSWYAIGAIGFGMVFGAQFGARLSARLQGYMLVRVLAGILLTVGGRAVFKLMSV